MLPTPPTYLTSREVRRRYSDISDMSLWRWLHDEKLQFPKPTVIQKRRYWQVAQLEAWERKRATGA